MYPHVGLDDECDWDRLQPRYFIFPCRCSIAGMPTALRITPLPHSTWENVKANANQRTFEMAELSIVNPSSQLCTHCQSSKWPQVPARHPPDTYGSPLYETFLLLQESADRGCTLCRFFWSYVINQHSITKETVGLLAKGSLDQSTIGAGPNGAAMFLHVKDSSMSLDECRLIHFDTIEGDSIDRYNYLNARQIKGTIRNFTSVDQRLNFES